MITVIIPTYKPKEYINQCLQSLDTQTLDINLFEVIVILNGEKEPYYSDIKQLLDSCSFNNRLFHTDTAGVSNARNIGLDNAKGEYICFIDDDDWISSTYLENLYKTAIRHPNSIIASDVRTFGNSIDGYGIDYISRAYQKFTKIQTNSIFRKRSFLSSSCCKIIPKNLINDRRFEPRLKNGEDTLFMTALTNNLKDIVLASPETIYYRRIRESSATTTHRSVAYIINNKYRLIVMYIKLYLSDMTEFNLLFFLYRIICVILSRYNRHIISKYNK